jgi:hypothetical protein
MAGDVTLFGWARGLSRCGMRVHIDGVARLGAARLGESFKITRSLTVALLPGSLTIPSGSSSATVRERVFCPQGYVS